VLAYGNFLTILLNFIILAFIIFLMVRLINKARSVSFRKQQGNHEPIAPPSEEIILLRDIRDALRKPEALR
jgi:large conductance mechanosensitive channel